MLSMKEFGELITTKRKEFGYTQETFAGKLGITPQAVSKWENGIGYPDITLFPAIADVFNMSIDELFGRQHEAPEVHVAEQPENTEKAKEAAVDDSASGNESAKEAEPSKKKKGFFKHFNIGGAKFSLRFDDSDDGREAIESESELETFDSIDMELNGSCDVGIISSDSFRYEASGSERFMKSLNISSENGTLKVVNEKYNSFGIFNENNELKIYTALNAGKKISLKVNGSGDVDIGHYFEEAVICIHGSGDVNAESIGSINATVTGSGDIEFDSANTAELQISGSGDINIGVINNSVNASISGSGDIDIDSAHDATIKLAGSGDAKIGTISGSYLNAFMSGSSDVTASGNVDFLKIVASGSCDFDGSGLTANEADITASGPCDIEIDRIIGQSREKIDRIAELRVNQRS